jgi:hypothetical protein
MFLFKPHFKGLGIDISGLSFNNPVGLCRQGEPLRTRHLTGLGLGFLTLTPDTENILAWIQQLAEQRRNKDLLLGVNLKKDIEHSFSLVYDFADFIIIDTDSNEGIGSVDLPDIPDLLDELLNLRLCYEHFTPVFLRIPSGLTVEEQQSLLSYCQLSGINGIVVAGAGAVHQVLELTQRRIPVMGTASSPEQAHSMLQDGASLVEMDVRPPLALKLLKILEKEAKKT